MMKACFDYYNIYNVNSRSFNKLSRLKYIVYKKQHHADVYSDSRSIVYNRNVWDNYIKKKRKKIYIYNIKK